MLPDAFLPDDFLSLASNLCLSKVGNIYVYVHIYLINTRILYFVGIYLFQEYMKFGIPELFPFFFF